LFILCIFRLSPIYIYIGKLKGTVGLSEIVILCEERSENKKVKYEFQLQLASGSVLELSSDTFDEREEWIETFNVVCYYFIRQLVPYLDVDVFISGDSLSPEVIERKIRKHAGWI
jgi:hypothetical protein